MDGELHVEGECCGEDDIMGRECPRCGGRLHQQPVYGGIANNCEVCGDHWFPRGTFATDHMVDGAGAAGSFTRGLVEK